MPEYVYGYAIRRGRLFKRAARLGLVSETDTLSRSELNDVLLNSFVTLAQDAKIFGKVLLRYTKIHDNDEMIMALASNNPKDFLPTYPSLPDPSDVERLKTLLEATAPPRWYRTS
ncbi:hypothetical protein BD779DRAFT_1474239 [Infundibulicybe gibba]|nr:hypothetical protein BD779DRAFT_1474239 [Infundibulicybe gibba]